MNDAAAAGVFYAVVLAVGAGALVPASVAFRGLPSGGVLLARPIALAAAALVAWLACGVAGARYGLPLALAALAVPWIATGVLLACDRALLREVAKRWRWLALGESAAVALFVLMLGARVLAGGGAEFFERPLQLMLLSSLRETSTVPPPDLWLAGHQVAYHHLLYLQVDMPARLAAIAPAVALNLVGPAFIAAGGAAFGAIAADIVALSGARRSTVAAAGALGCVAAIVAAPLRPLFAADAAANTLAALGPRAPLVELARQDAMVWEWVMEPPAYMVMSGSAHANVIVLALIATATALAVLECAQPRSWRDWRRQPLLLGVAVLTFAALGAGNPWSAPPCATLWVVAGTIGRVGAGYEWRTALGASALRFALPALCALALAMPLLATLDSAPPIPAPALGPLSAPGDIIATWGAFGATLALALAAAAGRPTRTGFLRASAAAVAFAVVAWLAVASFAGPIAAVQQWTPAGIAGAAIAALAAAAAATWAWMLRGRPDACWAVLAATATWLILAIETYELAGGPGWGRANTLLKFSQPAWLWASCALGAGVALYLPDALRRATAAWRWRVGIALCGCASAAALAWLPAVAAIAIEDPPAGSGTLDARAALHSRAPGLAAAARWTHGHMDGRHVAAEAATIMYPDRSNHRRSMLKGGLAEYGAARAYVLTPHVQRIWRSSPHSNQRLTVNAALYLSADPALARAWGITHVFVGPRERVRYGAHVLARFADWPVAFTSDGARLYEVP